MPPDHFALTRAAPPRPTNQLAEAVAMNLLDEQHYTLATLQAKNPGNP